MSAKRIVLFTVVTFSRKPASIFFGLPASLNWEGLVWLILLHGTVSICVQVEQERKLRKAKKKITELRKKKVGLCSNLV